MLNLRTGKNDLAPVALTRRDFGKGLAAILAAGCAPAIASAAARGAGGNARMGGMRGAAAFDYYDGVEYLQSSGTQYIDTQFYPNINSDFVLEMATFVATSYSNNAFGCRDTSSGPPAFGVIGHIDGSWSIEKFASSWQTSFAKTVGGKHTFSAIGSNLYYDGSSVGSAGSSGSFSHSVYVFAFNNNGALSALSCAIYSLKLFKDGKYARHFVPVLHEGEGKMLDLVHNKLYANAGTGSFIVGPRTCVIQVPKQGIGANTPSI